MKQLACTPMNCDFLAPHYEVLEHLCFGSYLERMRFAFLGQTMSSQRAIVCGGGDGRFLARLLHLNRSVRVDFVDLSAKMVDLAERRITGMGRSARARVTFHVGDIREFAPQPAGYDLISTHFFLDCFHEAELAEVVGNLAGWATPNATWIVSDFRETTGWVRRAWTKGVIRGLYAAFRVTTGLQVTRVPDYESAIANSGFELRYKEKALGGLLHSSFWTRSICAENIPGWQRTNR